MPPPPPLSLSLSRRKVRYQLAVPISLIRNDALLLTARCSKGVEIGERAIYGRRVLQLQFRGPARQNIIRREFDERSLVNYCTWALVRQPGEKRCTQNFVPSCVRETFFQWSLLPLLLTVINYEGRDVQLCNSKVSTLLLSKDSSRNSNCFHSKRDIYIINVHKLTEKSLPKKGGGGKKKKIKIKNQPTKRFEYQR